MGAKYISSFTIIIIMFLIIVKTFEILPIFQFLSWSGLLEMKGNNPVLDSMKNYLLLHEFSETE